MYINRIGLNSEQLGTSSFNFQIYYPQQAKTIY